MYEAQIAAELQEMEKGRQRKEYEKQIIEEERLRLLDQYASELKAYLPKGILRNEKDYERVIGRKLRR